MRRSTVRRAIPYIILTAIAIAFLLPLAWLVVSSFNPGASTALVLPEKISAQNYREVLGNPKIQSGFRSSILISVTQTCIVLVVAFLAAYPLSRYNLKAAQKISMSMLFLTSIPITAVMVPVYQMFIQMHLVDSVPGTIVFLTASGLPYAIWMTKNFLDGVAVELEEAAWIDGASAIQGMLKVVMPLMMPGVFTVAMFTFVGSWGNFFVPFILLQSTGKLPASVNIYRFFGEHGAVAYGQLCAYSIIYMIPVFILYFFSQNYMSKGFVMTGASKG